MADAQPTRSFDELADLVRHAPPPTPDDISITMDGRRLDTKDKVLAFLAEIEIERAAGVTVEDLLERGPPTPPLTSPGSSRSWAVTTSST